MDLGIAGKRALVIGASRGLGAAIASELLAEGCSVVVTSRDPGKPFPWRNALSPELTKRVALQPLDLARQASIEEFCKNLLDEGGVDIIVNNSGGPKPSSALESTRADWISAFEAMAANLFHLNALLIPHMVEKRWGRIITIASSGIIHPIPNLAISNGVRASVLGWSKTLAGELADKGITVNVVSPGRIDTERVAELDVASAQRTGRTLDDARAGFAAAIPAKRYGEPVEFAAVVAFLASTRASYITGSNVRVDGGMIGNV